MILKRLGLKAEDPKPNQAANRRDGIVPTAKSSAKRLAPGQHASKTVVLHAPFVSVSSRSIRLHLDLPIALRERYDSATLQYIQQ